MAKAPGITEAQWQAQVVGLASFYGWKAYHPPDNRPSAKGKVQRVEAGFPDWTLIRDTDLLLVELKTDTGRLGPGQADWLEAFRVVGAAWREEVLHLRREVTYLVTGEEGIPDDFEPAGALEVYVWRPRDFEEVQARLGRGRRIVRPEWAPATDSPADL